MTTNDFSALRAASSRAKEFFMKHSARNRSEEPAAESPYLSVSVSSGASNRTPSAQAAPKAAAQPAPKVTVTRATYKRDPQIRRHADDTDDLYAKAWGTEAKASSGRSSADDDLYAKAFGAE